MEPTMPNRRAFFNAVASAGVGLAMMRHTRTEAGGAAAQAGPARREVMLSGKRVRVVDLHCHCVIPEAVDVVKGTPLASTTGGGGGNNVLGPQRLQVMDRQGLDIQALSINGYWWYAADRDLARRIVQAQNEGLARWV